MHELEESIMAERRKIKKKTVMYTGRARQNKENKSFEIRKFLIRHLI